MRSVLFPSQRQIMIVLVDNAIMVSMGLPSQDLIANMTAEVWNVGLSAPLLLTRTLANQLGLRTTLLVHPRKMGNCIQLASLTNFRNFTANSPPYLLQNHSEHFMKIFRDPCHKILELQ